MWREKLQLHKSNPIAALYPSCKFLILCLYAACSFVLGTIGVGEGNYPLFLIPWFFIVPILSAASGVWKRFLRAFRAVLFIAALILAVQSLLIPSEVVVWQLGFLRIYQAGLKSGLSLSFSIMNIAGMFVWMFQTTENKEFTRALEDSGMNYKAAYVFISSLQMIDVLGKNSRTIMNAQRARGVETEGNMIVRAKAFFPSLVPLIVGAITSSEERVLTLESKGFDVNGPKTHLFELKKSGKEPLAAGIAIVVAVAVIAGRIVLWVL